MLEMLEMSIVRIVDLLCLVIRQPDCEIRISN